MKKSFIGILAGIGIFITGCGSSGNKENKAEDKYPVINPVIMDTVYYKEYVADIQAVKNVEIRARVHGAIEKIHVDEGQLVQKGQLLFSIQDHAYREELLKARAQLKSAIAEAKAAEVSLRSAKQLVEQKVISNTELELAESKLEALNAKIEEARSGEAAAELKLSFTKIKAPFDGIIDRIPLKIGSLVDDGTLLTSISDNNEVFAYFNVSESEYLNFVLNEQNASDKNEVTLLLANSNGHPYKGKVETIEGEIDKETGNISFRARFPNPEKILKHGASGKVRLKNEVKNALIIPQKATFEIQEKIYAFVVDADNKVRMQSLIPGLRIPHLFVVEKGISPSDKILYDGIQKVKEGEVIEPEIISFKDILKQLAQK